MLVSTGPDLRPYAILARGNPVLTGRAALVLEPGVLQRSGGASGDSAVHVNGARDCTFIINIGTRGGQNAFHGTAFEFYRKTRLTAASFLRPRAAGPAQTPRQSVRRAVQLGLKMEF